MPPSFYRVKSQAPSLRIPFAEQIGLYQQSPRLRLVQTIQALLVGAWAAVLLDFAYIHDVAVPFVSAIDLLIHESGHFIFSWAPQVVTASMGSGWQCLLPLLMGLYLFFYRKKYINTAFCIAWAGENFQQAATYIADAPFKKLQLIFGTEHDWAFVLGQSQCNCLNAAGSIANIVRAAGFSLIMFSFCLLAYWLFMLWNPNR